MIKELIAAAIGIGVVSAVVGKSRAEEKLRKETPFSFSVNLNKDDFEDIVYRVSRQIKKRHLSISIIGPVIYGSYSSQSGLTTYDFSIDFNDYGKLTGRYWLRSENSDSSIPERIASGVHDEIERILSD